MSDVEQMIKDRGLTAPRITPEHIESVILHEEFHKLTDVLTMCVITLKNGFTVTGESACASPENYDVEIGNDIAFRNAVDKIWVLEGYLLKEKLYIMQLNSSEGCDKCDKEDEVVHEAGPDTPDDQKCDPA